MNGLIQINRIEPVMAKHVTKLNGYGDQTQFYTCLSSRNKPGLGLR